MKLKRYVVVIDGGGTKSQIDIYSETMEVEFSLTGLFANFSVDASTSMNHLEQLLDKAAQKIPSSMWKRIVLGISGIQTYPSVDALKKQFETKYSTEVSVVTDVQLAKQAYLHQDGILVIAGTGSIAIGVKNHLELSVGGWGHILGDEGSGYALSIRYLKHLIARYDYGQKPTEIDKAVMNHLHISNAQSLKQVVYSGSKDQVASISKKLSEYLHDVEVRNIFIEEAKAFSNQVVYLIRRLGFESQVPVSLMGSLFESSDLYRETFIENVKNQGFSIQVNNKKDRVTLGGYYIDKELM